MTSLAIVRVKDVCFALPAFEPPERIPHMDRHERLIRKIHAPRQNVRRAVAHSIQLRNRLIMHPNLIVVVLVMLINR